MSDPLFSPAADAAIAAHATKATVVTGTSTTALSFAIGTDWVTITGLAVTVGMAVVSLVFKLRDDARRRQQHKWEAEEHAARMRQFEIESQMRREVMPHTAQVDE